MGSQELKDRTKKFALRVIRLCGALPGTYIGRRIGDQLVRCGTSIGANYRAACRARSVAEFNAKLGIVLEEADETSYWLEIVMDAELLRKSLVEPLYEESEELNAIFYSALQSARTRTATAKREGMR